MRWFHWYRGRDPDALELIAKDAERSAEAMEQDANKTARRIEPTLSDLERRKRENAIYAAVMDSLRGAQ